MRKKIGIWILLFTFAIASVGCKQKAEKDGITVYYLDALGNGLATETHELSADTKEGKVKEMLKLLKTTPESTEYRRAISEDVDVLEISFDQDVLTLDFNRNYSDLTSYTEALVRAAVVKSMLQIDGIASVNFYVANEPLQDQNGVLIGTMTAESFVDDYGQETDSLTKTGLVLYFSSANGQSLIRKEVEVYYNTNIPKERLIIENLIKGSSDDNAKTVIPNGTKLRNISVTDGVCYVNFDSGFLNVDSAISSDVVLYSIVNSLTELDQINKVQILVNGASAMPENGLKFKLGTSYERDTSMVLDAVERQFQLEEGDSE